MIGRTLGHFEIVGALGKGGMGEVYRARDTRLGREVALKFLPAEMLDDVERRARFEREARTLATLSHPNIAAIHGLEEAEGQRFLAIELVDGEDLSELLKRGPVPLDDALRIATAIADGLEAAHEQGIVHRDLKPANVRLTADGQPKILDFGLARAVVADNVSDTSIWSSPTITAQFTQPGVILGTAAYMPPEQARGKPVDRRADIWSFGCLLFEMLSGKAPFAGESITDVLAEIVKSEPDWSMLPSSTPPRVKVLLWRCLQKDPRRRLRDIGEARYELGEAPSDPSGTFTMLGSTQEPTPRPWAAFAVIALVFCALGLALGRALLAPSTTTSAPGPGVVFEFVSTPEIPYVHLYGIAFAISPDGQTVLFATTPEGSATAYTDRFALAQRRLDQLEARRIPGVVGAINACFSPDGREFLYHAIEEGVWKRSSLTGGTAQSIGAVASTRQAWLWGNDGYFYSFGAEGVLRTPIDGGESETIWPAGSKTIALPHRYQLPGSRWLLFAAVEGDERAIVALDVESKEAHELIVGDAPIAVTPSGLLLVQRDAKAVAVPVDRESMTVSGREQVVLDQLSDDFAVSTSGTLIYTEGSGGLHRDGRFIWVDRDGTVTPAFGDETLIQPRYPRISPDGKQVVYTTGPGGRGQLWVRDTAGRRPAVNLTFSDHNVLGSWNPERDELAFKIVQNLGPSTVALLAANGGELKPRNVLPFGTEYDPLGFLDRDRLLVKHDSARGDSDLLVVDTATAEMDTVLATEFDENFAAVAPGGKWIAFEWSRSGGREIWVRRLRDGFTRRVSTSGGQDPVWAKDGSELYFQQHSALSVVPVRWNGDDIELGEVRELFRDRFAVAINFTPRTYDVMPDGRFLMLQIGGFDTARERTIVRTNWFAEVDRLFEAGSR